MTNVIIAIAMISEWIGLRISGNLDCPAVVISIVKAIDYTFTPLSGGALIVLMHNSKRKLTLLYSIFLGNALLQIISIIPEWMVVIDEQHYYSHGPLYPVYACVYIIVLAFLVFKSIQYGKSFKKQNRISLYATVGLIFVGVLMQEVFGGEVRTAYLALTLGATYLFIHYSEFKQISMDETIYQQQVTISEDPLTGLLSRFSYMEAMSAYKNNIPEDLAVYMIDINGLKLVNDTIGHEAGDELICGVANCITYTLDESSKAYRIGGDEFVIISNQNREMIEQFIIKFKDAISKWSGNKVKSLNVSIGYVLAKENPGLSIEELVKEADQKMYDQKKEFYKDHDKDRRR